MAIEDATVLADALLNNPPITTETKKKLFDKALQEYARLRVPRSQRIAKQSYYSGIISLGDSWWTRLIRDYVTGWLPMDSDFKASVFFLTS